MLNQAVARRYARALFDLAEEKGVIDQVDQEFALVVDTVRENPELQSVMEDLVIPPEVKQDLVRKLFSDKVLQLVMNFLLLTIQKRREVYLPKIYDEYSRLANEVRGIVEVEVLSAVPLADSTLKSLEASLATRLGKRVQCQAKVAPELIGGLVVRVGDEVLDGSVKTRLERMRERLLR